MPMGVVVREVFNNLPKIESEMADKVFEVMSEGAMRVTSLARDLVPIDTGALLASIYIVNSRGTNYNFAVYRSTETIENSYKGGFSEDIVPAEAYKTGMDTIIVAAAAPYAGYVEYGHATPGGGFVSPRPFLEPAFEEVLPSIYDKLNHLFDEYGG